ncbi:MAG: hypothetical protein J07HX64_02240 [halophilic archaeon J07HX64]|nr:MAG: hypothetical protein J07HX64_02240 [halophilic archaeon J07HX64]
MTDVEEAVEEQEDRYRGTSPTAPRRYRRGVTVIAADDGPTPESAEQRQAGHRADTVS